MGGVAEGKEEPSLGAVAVGPQGVQVPVGLTGQNRLVVEELESAGHVSALTRACPCWCLYSLRLIAEAVLRGSHYMCVVMENEAL